MFYIIWNVLLISDKIVNVIDKIFSVNCLKNLGKKYNLGIQLSCQ